MMLVCMGENAGGRPPSPTAGRSQPLRRLVDWERRREERAEEKVTVESPWYHSRQRHVVIVMDAMQPFTTGPLRWVLRHLVEYGCRVTLLGIMPWLNMLLQCKTWLDIWTLNLDDLPALQERVEWRSEKYQKVRAIVELCENHGAIPQMEVVQGYPRKLMVMEKISTLNATWVVFDQHLRKKSSVYCKRIPCNIVAMKDGEGAEMLRVRSVQYSGTTSATPVSAAAAAATPPFPDELLSREWKEILKKRKGGDGSSKESSCEEID